MKRTYDTMNDSDDEHLTGRQTLPVANLPQNFDGVPQDGMQYLFTVRRDSRLLPKYTRADLLSESSKPSTTTTLASKPENVGPSNVPPLLPSIEWRAIFVSNFKNFRKNCEPIRDSSNAPSRRDDSHRTKIMPEKKERDRWRAFIDGHPEGVWNPPSKPKASNGGKKGASLRAWRDERKIYNDLRSFEYGEAYREYGTEEPQPSHDNVYVVNEYGEVYNDEPEYVEAAQLLPTPSRTPQPEGPQTDEAGQLQLNPGPPEAERSISKKMIPRQPTSHLLCKMDNRYCLHLLMYFTYWIDMHLKQEHPRSSHLSQTHVRWMFALLSQVDSQLCSDEMSQLRNVARSCMALIKDLRRNPLDYEASEFTTEEPVDEKACWLIVTAILEFWVQRDLWMDAENSIRKE